MTGCSIGVTLKVRGPVITQSSSIGRFGVDAAMASSQGHYYLAGSLVKGLLSEAWQELGSVSPKFEGLRDRLLGKSSEDDNEPERGSLLFTDFADRKTSADASTTRFRIQIDSERGSVEQGQYQVIEAPYASGKIIDFQGTIRIRAKTKAEIERILEQLGAGLRWIRSVGAERTVGFGQVDSVEFGKPEWTEWRAPAAMAGPAAYRIALRFDAPACFAKRRIADNLFESEDTIAGGAIKGAIASMIALTPERWPLLTRHLSAIRFSHAFPAGKGERPKNPPLSLVKFGEDLDDVAWSPGPALRDGEEPKFRVDWKEHGDVLAKYGWPAIERELRVRTSIEGKDRRAKDAALFAYRMIVPKDVQWIGDVSLEAVPGPDLAGLRGELEALWKHGIWGLGKTKARAEVSTLGPAPEPAKMEQGEEFALVFETPALLCDPSRHLAPNGGIGSGRQEDMEAEYRAVWNDLGHGSLELLGYFHELTLAGSEYFRRRFQSGKPYRPYLLTQPGSVFLLKTLDAGKANECLERWSRRGVELSQAVRKFYLIDGVADGDLWRYCPYLPENGYGEIRVERRSDARQ